MQSLVQPYAASSLKEGLYYIHFGDCYQGCFPGPCWCCIGVYEYEIFSVKTLCLV
jgi:hypothetical protein